MIRVGRWWEVWVVEKLPLVMAVPVVHVVQADTNQPV